MCLLKDGAIKPQAFQGPWFDHSPSRECDRVIPGIRGVSSVVPASIMMVSKSDCHGFCLDFELIHHVVDNLEGSCDHIKSYPSIDLNSIFS